MAGRTGIRRMHHAAGMLLAIAPAVMAAAPPAGTRISFVSCPIVLDTRSVPCWLSDYRGDRYYLTIQSDVSAEVQPPMLGHQVLVEGVVSAAPQICGGIVLDQVRLSVMPERDANCNTMLPADSRYTVDFNPRPPGPSSGRLAFDRPAGPAARPPPPSGTQRIDIYFDVDRGVSFRHPGNLSSVMQTARQIGAKRMTVTGVRGAHRLSDGTLLRESPSTGQRRAEEVAGLLSGAGLQLPTRVEWIDGEAEADGVEDWRSRRVTIVLSPD
jgi:hypothetical protein